MATGSIATGSMAIGSTATAHSDMQLSRELRVHVAAEQRPDVAARCRERPYPYEERRLGGVGDSAAQVRYLRREYHRAGSGGHRSPQQGCGPLRRLRAPVGGDQGLPEI